MSTHSELITIAGAVLLGALVVYLHQKALVQPRLQAQLDAAHDTARRDHLTGLPNRAAAATTLKAWFQTTQPLCVLMGDLDDFKSLNDHHGHDFGDRALTHVAQLLRETVPHDFVARLHGDEFLILLRTDLDDALAAAHHLRARLAAQPIHTDAKNPVTALMSIGVAQRRPGHVLRQLLHDADYALYDAKKRASGVASFQPGPLMPAVTDRPRRRLREHGPVPA